MMKHLLKTALVAAFLMVGSCCNGLKAQVTVTADPGSDESMSQDYGVLQRNCIQLVATRADAAQQSDACKKLASEADKFSSSSHFITKRMAYVYCATSLIRNKQLTEAVTSGEKAIAVVQLGHDDESGSSAAYNITAQAKGLSGDLQGSDKNFEIAEDLQRKALNGPAGHSLNREYSQVLKGMLMFHAQVLTAMGNSNRAKAKTEEASRL